VADHRAPTPASREMALDMSELRRDVHCLVTAHRTGGAPRIVNAALEASLPHRGLQGPHHSARCPRIAGRMASSRASS
jgi:hypothetical protein